jgi:glutamine---fructose-6-phosphate transaminase (isomerizing)
MCGIFGLVLNSNTTCDAQKFDVAIRLLFRLSEPRGREAAGLALAGGTGIGVFKRATSPSRMLAEPAYQRYLDEYLKPLSDAPGGTFTAPVASLGHCRLVTSGSQSIAGNNQPIHAGAITGVHNGVVANVDELWDSAPDLSPDLDVDTEVLFRLMDQAIETSSATISRAVGEAFAKLEGSASIAFFRNGQDALTLATNTGSLFYASDHDQGWFVFASERFIVQQFLEKSPLRAPSQVSVHQLPAGSVASVDFSVLTITRVPFAKSDNVIPSATPSGGSTNANRSGQPYYDLEVQRCSRCILPHTYPFIQFDEQGVCNFCNHFEKQKFEGIEALNCRLEPHRSSTGDPDCIVALSGGRDSSYGLHVIKNEMGMTPIAYTYDWGLVTDLARRNQARLCGQLGVEHIIRADDIPAKRGHIRQNIEAWLKRPRLGMVPIFMAGDKMFFHHARTLREETGIETVIFCSGNELERCEFKVGFTGIDDTAVTEVLYRYPLWNKVRMALWYAKEYALNPSYFNSSFFDNVFSFYSTFVAREDFLHLYHYVPWDEGLIDSTLKGTYNWEGASESDNTWRVGDGYTSFINLIYYTVAGFSEYDTFISNQIRSGMVSREQGMAKAKVDNQSRPESLAEFARVIGFDLDATLAKINAIPKLY